MSDPTNLAVGPNNARDMKVRFALPGAIMPDNIGGLRLRWALSHDQGQQYVQFTSFQRVPDIYYYGYSYHVSQARSAAAPTRVRTRERCLPVRPPPSCEVYGGVAVAAVVDEGDSRRASPRRFGSSSSGATPELAPADGTLSGSSLFFNQKIFYFHVAHAFVLFAAVFVAGISSIVFL